MTRLDESMASPRRHDRYATISNGAGCHTVDTDDPIDWFTGYCSLPNTSIRSPTTDST